MREDLFPMPDLSWPDQVGKRKRRKKMKEVVDFTKAIGFYTRLGGKPCRLVPFIGAVCAIARISQDDIIAVYDRAQYRDELTPYWMGWVDYILKNDSTASLRDHRLPKRLLGFYRTNDYQKGWQDAQYAASKILSFLRVNKLWLKEVLRECERWSY
jgi:hypothetical protein